MGIDAALLQYPAEFIDSVWFSHSNQIASFGLFREVSSMNLINRRWLLLDSLVRSLVLLDDPLEALEQRIPTT